MCVCVYCIVKTWKEEEENTNCMIEIDELLVLFTSRFAPFLLFVLPFLFFGRFSFVSTEECGNTNKIMWEMMMRRKKLLYTKEK